MKTKASFTKKDLIVTLGCIVFLLANIAAIGPGGRRRARQALCLSRLHKWGQIFQAYTADNDGYFHARRVGDPGPFGYGRIWIYVYKPYYNDPKMRYCPAAANDNRNEGTFGVWDLRYGSWRPDPVPGEGGAIPFGSYGLNRAIVNLQPPDSASLWRRADVRGADKVPVLLDGMYVNIHFHDPGAEPPRYDGDWTVGDSQAAACINRHDGFINCLFMDFSARKVGLKELWTLKGSRTYNTCGQWTLCGGVQPTDWPKWLRGFQDY